MKKHIHFVYDFKFPNGYLQFGYDKSTIRNNFFYQVEYSNTEEVVLSNPYNPSEFTTQIGMFADEYISSNKNWNKIGVNQIQDILDRKHYNNTQNYFIICLEATNSSSFFEYYLNPNLDFDNLFSPKLLDFFKKRQEFKLILVDNREGSYYHNPALFTKISKWLDKNNIVDKNKVIISTCNEKINDIPINDKRIRTYNNDYYLYYSGKFIVECEERNNIITETNNDYVYSLQDKIKFDKREKYFLNYNRNSGRFHRPFLINELYNKNILDKGIVSLLKTNEFDNIITDIKNNLKDYNPDFGLDLQNEDYKTIYLNHKNWYPLVIDNDNEEEVAWYHNFLSRKDEYEKTYFTIVSETNVSKYFRFLTEKTVKPIMNLHPFIIFGNPGSIGQLQRMGFQTFSDFWDESYDEEKDFKKRTEMLINLVKELTDKSFEEWNEMLTNMEPILRHNKNVLLKMERYKQFPFDIIRNILNHTI